MDSRGYQHPNDEGDRVDISGLILALYVRVREYRRIPHPSAHAISHRLFEKQSLRFTLFSFCCLRSTCGTRAHASSRRNKSYKLVSCRRTRACDAARLSVLLERSGSVEDGVFLGGGKGFSGIVCYFIFRLYM